MVGRRYVTVRGGVEATCREVRAWLLQKGVELDKRDFFADRFSGDELRRLIGDHSPSELFS
jgi:arsenate reductase-like glutaredoxin family protein